MKYYIISGERSGDLHASNLIKSIKKRDQQAIIRGTGGEYSQAAGLDLFKHYTTMAFMGIWEVITHLSEIKKIYKEVQKDLIEFKPDVLILVDFGGFNMKMAKFAKENNIKVFYYISPKVWAWNTKRAYKVKAFVDRMFVIMPFEKAFYKKFDYEVDYVGNPVADAVAQYEPDVQFVEQLKSDQKPIVAILAGSRKQEVTVMLENMVKLIPMFPECKFVIAGVDNLPKSFYEKYKDAGAEIYYDKTYDILHAAYAAVVTSGTATLETAIIEVPQVVCYKTNPITYFLGKPLLKVKHFSLPNLIAGKEIIPELLQHEYTTETVAAHLKEMLTKEKHDAVVSNYKEMKAILGGQGASERTAELMLTYLNESK